MKRFLQLVCGILFATSLPATGSDDLDKMLAEEASKSTAPRWIVYAQIGQIRVDSSGRGFVYLDGVENGVKPACVGTSYPTSMAFDTTTPAGAALFDALLSARDTKSLLHVNGKDSCDLYSSAGIQDLNYIRTVESGLDDVDLANSSFTGTLSKVRVQHSRHYGALLFFEKRGRLTLLQRVSRLLPIPWRQQLRSHAVGCPDRPLNGQRSLCGRGGRHQWMVPHPRA